MMSEIARDSWYWLMLTGLLAGTLGGMLGVGGGIVMVPVMVLLLGFDQKVAQGVSLSVIVPLAAMAAFRYYLNPQIKVDGYAILLIVPLALIGANLGSHFAAVVPTTVLRRIFAVFVIVAGIRMLWTR